MEAYKVIFQQLGGNKFKVMTGATVSRGVSDNVLICRFRGSHKFNCVEIRLNGWDLYDVRFVKYGTIRTGFKVHREEEVNNVYCDQLRDLFESKTGLYTSL